MTQFILCPPVAEVEERGFKIISDQPIDLGALLTTAHHPKAGAVVLFSGEARNHNLGKEVDYLEYEAFIPMAEQMIGEIIEESCKKWTLDYAICQHRIGKVSICESAVCVITASAHRKEAYEANQYIIHRVKHEVPIWKKEYFKGGTFTWGNNCNCADPNVHDAF
jgi:molybdopterin synthase catalytic subunit